MLALAGCAALAAVSLSSGCTQHSNGGDAQASAAPASSTAAVAVAAATSTPAPVPATAAPATDAPVAPGAHTAAPVAATAPPTPAPTPEPVIPTAPPKTAPPATTIFSAVASPPVVHAGETVNWIVTTTDDVKTVAASVSVYHFELAQASPGRFVLSFPVPANVPFFFHGHYDVQLVAHGTSDAAASLAVDFE